MYITFKEYVKKILETVEYKEDTQLGCVVAIASILPGCMTQGDNFEDARDNIIDAIELWIIVGLREGEAMPLVNGSALASSIEHPERQPVSNNNIYA